MRRRSFVCGLSTATLATGVLLVGSTSASAQNTEYAPAQLVTGTTTVLPPVFGKARFTCHDEGANVTARLRNANATVQYYMVGITAGDIHYDYVVTLAARGAELVEFGGLPNGTYLLQVQNAAGAFDAQTRVRVRCNVTPPTGTPTRTPTASPSQTPTATPTTTAPTTPVGVPTAVDAGLSGPLAQDDSNQDRTIVGIGLLAAVAIIIGLAALLVRRRRGLHHL
ncbi:hypothetical protein [Kribbella sp. NBC_00359]|uniref:hypothetical protein n=1 Tax=Kribbella sp. NBC_00359 TaxID=2975966 RepID=UPI002E1D59FF